MKPNPGGTLTGEAIVNREKEIHFTKVVESKQGIGGKWTKD